MAEDGDDPSSRSSGTIRAEYTDQASDAFVRQAFSGGIVFEAGTYGQPSRGF